VQLGDKEVESAMKDYEEVLSQYIQTGGNQEESQGS